MWSPSPTLNPSLLHTTPLGFLACLPTLRRCVLGRQHLRTNVSSLRARPSAPLHQRFIVDCFCISSIAPTPRRCVLVHQLRRTNASSLGAFHQLHRTNVSSLRAFHQLRGNPSSLRDHLGCISMPCLFRLAPLQKCLVRVRRVSLDSLLLRSLCVRAESIAHQTRLSPEDLTTMNASSSSRHSPAFPEVMILLRLSTSS